MFQFNSTLSRNVEKIQKLAPCLHHSVRFRPVGAAMAGSDRTAPPPHAARRPVAVTRIAVPRLTHPTSWSLVHQTASARSVLMMTLITTPNPQKLPKPSVSAVFFLPFCGRLLQLRRRFWCQARWPRRRCRGRHFGEARAALLVRGLPIASNPSGNITP